MNPAVSRPPVLSRLCLRLALHPDDRDCALSDLAEEFEKRRHRDGGAAARRWYRRQTLTSLLPALQRRTGTTELRWAWRGVRSRGWRAVCVVVLLSVALSATAIVFTAADAFVFRTLPYHDPERLVVIERTGTGGSTSDYIWRQALLEWRNHRDLFAAVHAHSSGSSAWLTTSGVTETVPAAAITPGLLELLGVLPKWGRPFVDGDAGAGAPLVVIIGEALAGRQFGDAQSAVGQPFFTGRDTPTVIGVMPASFRFPTAREAIWRPLDLATWPNNRGIGNVARLAPAATVTDAAAAVAAREGAVNQVVENASHDAMQLRSLAEVRANAGATSTFAMLLGASACLLLLACANVASLELAAAARRVRVHALQSALGASRAALVRGGLWEGAFLLAASAAGATALTGWGIGVLDAQLTAPMRDALTNPLDVDLRALGFMLGIGAFAWLLTSLPAMWRLTRFSVVDGLRDDPRTMPVPRGAARARQILMAGQVALTTLLLAGALLYLRSYAHRAGLDKGFDATNLIAISVSPGPDAPKKGAGLETEILDNLRATSFIQGVSRTSSPPPATQSGTAAPLTIEGRSPTAAWVMFHLKDGDPEYFQTMDIRIVQGRAFDASTRQDQIVIDERFARDFWPDGSALGARFRLGKTGHSGVNTYEVIGVSRELRPDRLTNDRGEPVYVGYFRLAPDYNPLTYVARVDDEARLGDLRTIIRGLAPHSIVRVDTVNALYARLDADTRLAATVTSGFGIIALVVAGSGIYAVMAYLVTGRSKEIAIRMALGADRGGIRRLVLRSSLRFVVLGAAIGIAAALVTGRLISAQLLGVTAGDPFTYLAVATVLGSTALAATWWPARRAARIDPAITLRSQ
jgi:predicted permease